MDTACSSATPAFRRATSTSITTIAALLCGCAQPLAVPELVGLPYDEARARLGEAGWKARPAVEYGASTMEIGRTWPEVASCGVDYPSCIFVFVGPRQQCLEVTTEGEEMASFTVHATSTQCQDEVN